MTSSITQCRICGSTQLEPVINVGIQELTGVFPKTKNEKVTSGPLRLVKCVGEDSCGLLQLDCTYDLDEMYGENYGYRSGLNTSMVNHLRSKVEKILSMVKLNDNDLIVDIGSNDATTLKCYPEKYRLLGIDPTAGKFRSFYPEHIELIDSFFTKTAFEKLAGKTKAKVITSFSMFYDLPSPMEFMQDVYDVLDDDGVWVFEQSYMPTMLERNSYDTICHEHLEYYSLQVIYYMTQKISFNIIDVEFNDINGGSFSVAVAKKKSKIYTESKDVQELLKKEISFGVDDLEVYRTFQRRVEDSKEELLGFLRKAKKQGRSVYGLGASTKGNVILQYCGITQDLISGVAEVNEEKFSTFTPGTYIPILPESEVLALKPDYLLVLPWHFRSFFDESAVFHDHRLVYPLPSLEMTKGD